MADEPKTETPIPPAIAAGIVHVMANVKRLARLDENRFAHYSYTSIDDFLEAMGPLLAEAGIFILPEEDGLEIVETEKKDREGTTAWLHMRWSFLFGHVSGVVYGPLHRTVIVPASGAQAFGSSLSYSLKQFMRGVFQIPTGDSDDPDSQKKETLPSRAKQAGNDRQREVGDEPPPQPGQVSALRADAWRAVEDADKPATLLLECEHVRDSKLLPQEARMELLNMGRDKMWEFSQRSIRATTTVEGTEKGAAWYAKCWLLTTQQKTLIASAFGAVREELSSQNDTQEPGPAS